MEHGVIITYGDSEHDCIKEDGNCSTACPNYVRSDGFLQREAILLGLKPEPLHCAVLGGKNPDISQLKKL